MFMSLGLSTKTRYAVLCASLLIWASFAIASQRHELNTTTAKKADWNFDSDIHIFDINFGKLDVKGKNDLFKINCPQDGIWMGPIFDNLPENTSVRYIYIAGDGTEYFGTMRPSITANTEAGSAEKAVSDANAVYDAGNYKDALDRFVKIYNTWPDDRVSPYAMFMAGQCLCALQKFPEAITIHKALIAKYPQSASAQHALFRIACVTAGHLKKQDDGLALFAAFLKQYPDSALNDRVLFNIAAIHVLSGKTTQAAQEFALVIKNYPDGKCAKTAKSNLDALTAAAKGK